MSKNACEGKDHDIYPAFCNQPNPQSAFRDPTKLLCPGVGNYNYDPSNCDPGYWCGCSSNNPDECLPSNDTDYTRWIGHFTPSRYNKKLNISNTIFYNANLSANNSTKCPDSFYCPGLVEPWRCPDLCPPGHLCETPATIEQCPKGEYCPLANTEGINCTGIESCTKEGMTRYDNPGACAIMIVIPILFNIVIFVVQYFVKKRAGERKEARLAKKEGEAEPLADAEAADQPKTNMRTSSIRPGTNAVNIEFENLSYAIPKVGNIMRGVSGSLNAGELTAVMGPSGAGKTTFLNLVAGKIDKTGGSIKVNGEEKNLTDMKRNIGFVPQEDTMLRMLSVEEVIRHSALMRLPKKMPKQEKLELVDAVLETLEIDHVSDSIIGDENKRGISGGQRKRVNIGLELVTKPSLLCLDEPTSGLDSTTALTVVSSLKEMVNLGVNVVVVIHQPKYSIFTEFDKVLLLGQGGMTVYYGPTEGMVPYFESLGFPVPSQENPADFFMDVLSGTVKHESNPDFKKEDFFEEWLCSEKNPSAVSRERAKEILSQTLTVEEEKEKTILDKIFLPYTWFCSATGISNVCGCTPSHICGEFNKELSKNRETPGLFQQTWLLLQRSFLQKVRSPWISIISSVCFFLIGFLIWTAFDNDNVITYRGFPKAFLDSDTENIDALNIYLRSNLILLDGVPPLIGLFSSFMVLPAAFSIATYGPERANFFRECAGGMKVSAYWLAKMIDTMIYLLLNTGLVLALPAIASSFFLQPIGYMFIAFFLIIFGFYGLGNWISIVFPPTAAGLAFFVLASMMVQDSGLEYTPDPSSIYWKWLYWIFQGIIINEYEQYEYAFNVTYMNSLTPPDEKDEGFGGGEAQVGLGLGKGFNLSASPGVLMMAGFFTSFYHHVICLILLKVWQYKKQR